MTVMVVPPLDAEPWPSLGGQVCAFIETNLIHGPGDLRGQPARLDAEKRALVYRMYEVYPEDHPQAGRRRFKRVAVSLRKGSAKTEFAAWLAAAELHPDGPVRCVGWDGHGNPIGGPVNDPYIPMVAYTEEQSEELAYGALLAIISEGPLRNDFDCGLARIMRRDGAGKAVPLASAPDSRDGARTTFQHFDETHRFVLPRLREAHRTMLANVPKRRLADAWSLETTTAPAPGEGSVAEHTMDYARLVETGSRSDSRLFFFHRQAADTLPLTTRAEVKAAVLEASGPVAEWSDIDGIVEQFEDPTADIAYLERVWLNRLTRASRQAFDAERWKALAVDGGEPPPGELITLGFDGAKRRDATGLVGTVVRTGYQWPLGVWERPLSIEGDWEVPADEVHAAVERAFERWQVWRLYADPPYWEEQVATWSGRWGQERVIEWWTNRTRPMAYALQTYSEAIRSGAVSHSGSADLNRHIGNARRKPLPNLLDDNGEPLWWIQKERPNSPHKIDVAMAAVLSWEARNDALAAGAGVETEARISVF